MEENSSFMCEAILPLDFYMSWENIEAYPENEWRKLQDEDYSFAPGDSPTFRCCMEESDPPKNKIPRGYVSLYCEDEVSEISKLEAAKQTDDYSLESIYAEKTYSDIKSSYNGSTNPSDDEDGASTRNMNQGQKFMHKLEKDLLGKGVTPPNPRFPPVLRNNQGNRTFSQNNNNNNNPGPSNSTNKLGPVLPEIVVQDVSKTQSPSTPIPKDSNLRPSILQKRGGKPENLFFPDSSVFKFDNFPHQNGHSLLGPPRKNQHQNGGKSGAGAGESSRNIQSPPPPQFPPPSNDAHNTDFLSSGYESLATTSTPMSRSSSVMSEEARLRYRNLELKELWEYKPTTTRLGRGQKKSPIPLQCLIKVKKQRDEEDEEDDENENDKDDDDDEEDDEENEEESSNESLSSESDSKNNKKKKNKKRLKNRRASSTDDNSYKILNYLNSTQFSGIFCGDFTTLAKHMDMDASHAQVLGATVRCPVQYSCKTRSKAVTSASMFRSGSGDLDSDLDFDVGASGDDEKFRVLYTFTPCIWSKYFPQKSLIPFRQRLLDKRREQDKPEGAQWPKRIQVDSIEELGCHLTPLGFRSIQFFNTHQSLEWLTNFSMGESLLLSSFKQAHLRCYIFSSILFRAFISHMGPRGFGLEHIRNVMYLMCESDFIGWDDEQPGNHLKVLLNRLYDFLGRKTIPSFFNLKHNMLNNIPVENTQLVQAFLSKIRENLIIHCIYAFRNLTCLQPQGKWYPQADFKKLYRLVTKPREMDLLFISNPSLKGPAPEKNSKQDKKGKKKKKIDILDRSGEIERETEQVLGKKKKLDKQQRVFTKKYGKYAQQLEEKKSQEKKQEEATKLKDSVPPTEKRKSINLGKLPVPKFTNLRMVMIIDFFIQHFLEMAEKSIEFQAYSNATMYTLHVQNLCRLLKGMRLATTPMDESTINDYLEVTEELLKKIGPNSSDYIKAKLSHFDLPDGMSELFLSQPSTSSRPNSRTGGKSSPFSDKNNNNNSSNFTFASRKLPTPPASLSTSTPNLMNSMNMKRDLNQVSFPLIPRVGMSMLALPTTPSMFSPSYSDDPDLIHGDFELSTLDRVHHRHNYRSRPHLKYVQQDSPSHHRRQYRQHPGPTIPTSSNNFNSSRDMRPDSISPRPVSSNSYFSANYSIDSVPSSYNNDTFHW